MKRTHRCRLASLLLLVALPAAAVDTATLVSSTASMDCMEYRIVGVCYWLFCTNFGCSTRTSAKVRHYIPDAVVSSYAATGKNPWDEVAAFSSPNGTAESGGNATNGEPHENNPTIFKNVDVIGHPGATVFSQFASKSGYSCEGAGTAFSPYFLSTLDTVAWRYGIPEAVYPESLIPGQREIGSRMSRDLWGNVYPRSGFLVQTDDAKAAAVMAERAGDIVTRSKQVHVYRSLLADAKDGYWPAGALVESDASTGKWQPLTPKLSSTCAVFPTSEAPKQAKDGGYAWALWRPYACCKREGQTFLTSMDYAQ